jgi:hypothetical protein
MVFQIVGLIALVRQSVLEDFPNGTFDFCDSSSGVDFLDALRFGNRDSLIAFCDSFEEIAIGFFDPVAHERKCGLAFEEALGRDFVRDDKKKCNLGSRVANGHVNDGFHHLEIQLATVALVRSGRIVESIADDNFSGGESGANDLTDKLSSAGVHQKQFCLGSHRFVLSAVLERVANFFADGSAARLANGTNRITLETQMFGKQRDLRGFAASFGAFETDEKAGHYEREIRNSKLKARNKLEVRGLKMNI